MGLTTDLKLTFRATLALSDDPTRRAYEAFARAQYMLWYRAKLKSFLPWLLGLHLEENDGCLVGMAGCRPASEDTLFLECYLEAPIEKALTQAGYPSTRNQIAEIGNLCGAQAGAPRLLIAMISSFLKAGGFEWAVFTATRSLRNTFRRLGAPMVELQDADPDKVPGSAGGWGSYYSTDPIICAVSVPAMEAMLNRYAASTMLSTLRESAGLCAQSVVKGGYHA